MEKNTVLITAAKETFLVKVLAKKIYEAGPETAFAVWSVNEISGSWEGTRAIVIFMDGNGGPGDAALHFLADRAADEGVRMLLIGEPEDIKYVCDRIPGDLIYSTMVRPVKNEEFAKTVAELFRTTVAGGFRKNILVVDDDPAYLSLVRDWLRDKYKVSVVNSGLQAIKWLGKNRADLILLDHEMPVTTGPQVLEMLRSDPETSGIPVIFLTGKSDKESVMAVVALKPEGYFLKNIEKAELLDKLERFFAGR
ncbi:MAG: response regulator [Lachnospiraceae bacterium]|nr:response regulator [Lachnospiraceae bacterium]